MSTTEGQDKRNVYEIGYLLLPSIPEDSLDTLVSKITNAIEQQGGTRIDGEAPFLYPLAYEMSKQVGARKYVVHEAYLGWVKFDLPAQAGLDRHPIETVKSEIEKMEEVLRSLIVKTPRETTFTFAEARAKKMAAEAPQVEEAPVEEKEAPAAEADAVVE